MKRLRLTDYKFVLLCFFISRVVLLGIGYAYFYSSYPDGPPAPLDYAPSQGFLSWNPLCLLFYYDSVNYLIIANQGYSLALTPFFPLYPLLIALFGGSVLTAVLISNLCFLGFLFVLNKVWGRSAVIAGCAVPAGIYFSSAYTESLFLLLSTITLYCIKTGRWVHGAAAAGLSALTRPLGWALVAAFCFYNFTQAKGKSRFIFLIAVGLTLLYPGYLYLTFGDFLAFAHQNSAGYSREISLPWWGVWADIGHMIKGDVPLHWIITASTNMIGFMLILYVLLKNKEYRLYTGLYALIILSTPVTNFNYLPATHGLIRYASGCCTIYPTIGNSKGLVWAFLALEILMTVMVAQKWFIA